MFWSQDQSMHCNAAYFQSLLESKGEDNRRLQPYLADMHKGPRRPKCDYRMEHDNEKVQLQTIFGKMMMNLIASALCQSRPIFCEFNFIPNLIAFANISHSVEKDKMMSSLNVNTRSAMAWHMLVKWISINA